MVNREKLARYILYIIYILFDREKVHQHLFKDSEIIILFLNSIKKFVILLGRNEEDLYF
jgi:hypothetical protein